MNIVTQQIGDSTIAEVTSDNCLINNAEDGVDLLGNLYFNGYDKVVIHALNITPEFFNLENGMAGEILQKFSTYRVRLAIVGDHSKYTSRSLNDFIYESNKGKQVNFVGSIADAITKLSTM